MNPWTDLPQILIGELSSNTEMLLTLKNNKQRIPRKEKPKRIKYILEENLLEKV